MVEIWNLWERWKPTLKHPRWQPWQVSWCMLFGCLVYITLKRHPDDATSTTVASSPEVRSLRAVMSISQSIKPGKFFFGTRLSLSVCMKQWSKLFHCRSLDQVFCLFVFFLYLLKSQESDVVPEPGGFSSGAEVAQQEKVDKVHVRGR